MTRPVLVLDLRGLRAVGRDEFLVKGLWLTLEDELPMLFDLVGLIFRVLAVLAAASIAIPEEHTVPCGQWGLGVGDAVGRQGLGDPLRNT